MPLNSQEIILKSSGFSEVQNPFFMHLCTSVCHDIEWLLREELNQCFRLLYGLQELQILYILLLQK